mgnify:CR=1 FL=1
MHKLYLSAILDLCDRRIVSFAIRDANDTALVHSTLDQALETNPGVHLLLHSDRGAYTTQIFHDKLTAAGITQSMSRKGNCLDNAATEQVFGHIKDEFLRGRDWDTFESFKADLEAYIHHWNHVRRQVKLKGLTPAEFRELALRGAA